MQLHLADAWKPLFWNKVHKTDNCWIWCGSISNKGYGQVRINGRTYLAHRISFAMHHGPIDDGIWALHRCDIRRCVNPAHLFPGDASANMQDCANKGRLNFQTHPFRGEDHAQAKLTWEQVRQIRTEFEAGGITKAALARRHGIGACQAGNILRGKHWKEDVRADL